MTQDDDPPEVQDLEQAAERRMQQADMDPSDLSSAAAANRLLALAAELRQLTTSPLLLECRAITGWLDESGGAEDFVQRAADYRWGISITHHPAGAEDYLRALIHLARQASDSL